MTIDYSKTIHLPKTDFPRRAGLAQKEPQILARWQKMGLYARQRAESKGREKFVLHMGPPFANGHIHIGHVLSMGLKDIVCRSWQMTGYDAPLVPGFDCHGLPIEWKIEEKNRESNKDFHKDDDLPGFRKACRDFAAHWAGVQSQEFQRIGMNGDFANPYLTMDYKSEAVIASEIHKFLKSGALYRGTRPVMWSVPEQTALAEAEVEYKDITSDTVFVSFPVKEGPRELEGASVVIWTTTPWTLPGNRAVAYGADIKYTVVEAGGRRMVVASDLLQAFRKEAALDDAAILHECTGAALAGAICRHPLHGQGYDFDVPLLPGDFVTTDAGTGFVHIAPGHGEDDHRLGLANGIEVPETVGADGRYLGTVPLFAGAATYLPDGRKGPANKLVAEAIEKAGRLVAKGQVRHSYPHSWRSKAPVIFRTTPQWFISMDKTGLRETALREIKKTKWIPARGENRIASMVEQRGDWNISRQRAWGVPLSFFMRKDTHEPLVDDRVFENILRIYGQEGSDAWYTRPPEDFLAGTPYSADDYAQVRDIIDVWFESGSTQGFVLEQRQELSRPADLYLEGSDQHRGWFQSSLLVGCGTRGNAPFKNVLTHGFILDEKGYKMSKSQGNVTDPMKLCDAYGADILRLWAANSDYTEDTKFGDAIMKAQADVYRRIRGTFCYLLGSLDGQPGHAAREELSTLDRYMLHRLYEMDALVRKCIAEFDFQRLISSLHNFCARDLSAFYFDICKDALYCEAKDSPKRRAIVTVLDHVFNHLVHWIAPFLCFTAEEAWLSYKGLSPDDTRESIHLRVMPGADPAWRDDALAARMKGIIAARAVVTGALEPRRAAKEIGASLEAAPVVHVADPALMEALESVDFADICITSAVTLTRDPAPEDAFTLPETPGVAVAFARAEGEKCARCWKYTPDVGSDPAHPSVCARCADAAVRVLASAA